MRIIFKKTIVVIALALALVASMCIPVFATEDNVDYVFTTSYNPFVDANNATVYGNRDTISNTNDYPYSAIAKLDIAYNCGCSGKGTGFMISERCLLTAGHCLVCEGSSECLTDDRSVLSVTAYFGFVQGNNNVPIVVRSGDPNTIIYCEEYVNSGFSKEYDYGYIVFPTSVGNSTGWFGLAAINDNSLDGLSIQVAGYEGEALYKDSGTITSVTDTRIKYNADTEDGQSGGPVYANFATYGYMAVGIHTTGNSLLVWRNSGWRITTAFIDELAAKGYVTRIN